MGSVFSGQTTAGDKVVGVAINGRMESGLSETVTVGINKSRGPRFSLYYQKDLDFGNDQVGVSGGWKW